MGKSRPSEICEVDFYLATSEGYTVHQDKTLGAKHQQVMSENAVVDDADDDCHETRPPVACYQCLVLADANNPGPEPDSTRFNHCREFNARPHISFDTYRIRVETTCLQNWRSNRMKYSCRHQCESTASQILNTSLPNELSGSQV